MTDLRMEDQVTVEKCPECGSSYVDECACGAPVIYVDVLSQGKIVWSAECDDVEEARRAAQVGWDESWDSYFSKSRQIRYTVDGKVVLTMKSRP